MRVVVAGLMMGLMLIGHPVAASDGEQTFVDRCTAPLDPATERDLLAPWLDICGGDVAVTAGDAAAIRVSLTFAGDLTSRTDSHYEVSWTAGGCDSHIVWADGAEGVREGPIVAARITGGWMDVNCGQDSNRYVLPAEMLTIAGDTLEWAIPLTGDLGPVAGLYEQGTVLTALQADAGPDAGFRISGGNSCIGTTCTQIVADRAFGADVVVVDD